MDLRIGSYGSNVAQARWHASAALSELERYDRAAGPGAAGNCRVINAALQRISPGATGAGAAALDAARWERQVSVRQLRDLGSALELLDRGWWALNGRGGAPDVDGARSAVRDAVSMLDRAASQWGRRWTTQPLVA